MDNTFFLLHHKIYEYCKLKRHHPTESNIQNNTFKHGYQLLSTRTLYGIILQRFQKVLTREFTLFPILQFKIQNLLLR